MATHTVVSGDSLSRIAADHRTTPEAIQAANPDLITDINVIQVGWVLTIPGGAGEDSSVTASGTTDGGGTPAAAEYVVKAGDTLGAIAAQFGTTVAELQALNNIPDANIISVGQVIKLPGGSSGQGGNGTTRTLENQVAAPGELRFTALPLRMPPGRINGVYLEPYSNGTHMGYDLGGVAIGTPIFAAAGGKVHVHRPNDGTGFDSFGICVVIDHPGTPYWSIYAHMDGTDLTTGATVSAGDVIGRLGWTGFVDPPNENGAHLHWQVSNNRWFPKTREATADPTSFLFGVEMPGVDDIPLPAGAPAGVDGELGGPETPPDSGVKPGFEAATPAS